MRKQSAIVGSGFMVSYACTAKCRHCMYGCSYLGSREVRNVEAKQIIVEKALSLDLEAEVLDEQVRLLSQELRTTTQRVNLFEKVKIPETKANIKKITVYLGDEQVAAVVRSKISKKKLQAKIDEEQEAGK